MTKPSSADPEIHSAHPPAVPLPQNPLIARHRLQWLVNLFPPGQFVRYLCLGVCNTLFASVVYVVLLPVLNAVLPSRWLHLTVVLASVLSIPVNITVSYFGYKFLCFAPKETISANGSNALRCTAWV
jgi:putative flippase GtrA